MRSLISSQHHRPPNYLISGDHEDPLLLKEWILVLRGDGKSPRTIEGYADSVRQLASFLRKGGFPSLAEVTAEHIREWLNELRNRGNKPATVNTRYRGVHAFYKWLVKEGEVRENPLAHIQPPQIPETVQPYYTPEDLQLVLRSLRGRRLRGIDAARTRAAILVLFDTGLRASELCSLRLEDVNWDAQNVVVRYPKGGNERVVSLGTTAMRSLMSYLRVCRSQSPWLFSTLDGSRLTKKFRAIVISRPSASASPCGAADSQVDSDEPGADILRYPTYGSWVSPQP